MEHTQDVIMRFPEMNVRLAGSYSVTRIAYFAEHEMRTRIEELEPTLEHRRWQGSFLLETA